MKTELQKQYDLLKRILTSCGILNEDGTTNYDFLNSQRLTAGKLYVTNQRALAELAEMEKQLK